MDRQFGARSSKRALPQLAVLSALFALSVVGCAGRTPKSEAAPAWIQQPPPHNARALFFVGEASADDPKTARELAVGRALTQLSQYCGATVSSNFELVDQEHNGVASQKVKETLTVAGEELALQGVVVEEAITQRSRRGHVGYARILWPRAEYEAVKIRRRERAEAALVQYRNAERDVAAAKLRSAQTQLREARAMLGKADFKLSDPTIPHTGVLKDSIEALSQRIAEEQEKVAKSLAAGIVCYDDGRLSVCPTHRVGQVLEQITQSGLNLSQQRLSADLTRSLAKGLAPSLTRDQRDSAFLLAVRFQTQKLAEEDGFVFAHCSARAVVYDTRREKVVASREIGPKKGGHVRWPEARERGCQEVETTLHPWLGDLGLQSPER